MRKPICWSERLEDGVKREIRVSFPGEKILQWSFHRSDREGPDRTASPTREHWEHLLVLADRWYHRRRLPHKHLELIREQAEDAMACEPVRPTPVGPDSSITPDSP